MELEREKEKKETRGEMNKLRYFYLLIIIVRVNFDESVRGETTTQ